jgi:glyoxylase-like metal-dependent hydrolase (beta-lactamase superfamily II)
VDQRVVIKQLLAGVDFAGSDPYAGQLVNFVYLIGDRRTQDCLLVDPAWDVEGLLKIIQNEGMNLSGVLVTHYHPDHIGGDLFGYPVDGLAGLKERIDVPVHVHRTEAEGVRRVTGLSASDLVLHDSDDKVQVGQVPVRLLHTPGHTPGSQCFLVEERSLVSGDTLFVQGCGRVDLPGGDPDEMYHTLTQRLARLPDEVALYPGHHYGPEPTSTLGEQRRSNPFMTIRSLDDWRRLMG